MLQTDLRTQVRAVLEDPGGFRFSDGTIDRYTTDAIRRVERSVGRTQRRLALSLVQGVQEYLLPADGVLRITSVQVIPENGSQPRFALQQVDLNNIPVVMENEGDPRIYSIDLASGVNADQMAINVFPAAARSASDSLIVTYEADFTTAANIPFPATFDLILVRLTAFGCLSESDDETSVRKGIFLKGQAEEELRDLAWMDSQSAMNNERLYP